jgi:concanavalin A-like lectin/glucanase superfamily protein
VAVRLAGVCVSYQSEVLTDSPTGYWRLGEPSGTSAADASGNSHTGTYVNTPTLGVTGALASDSDTAASFALGSSEYVTTTTLGTLGQSLLTSSWEWWISQTYATDRRAMFGTVDTSTSMVVAVYSNSARDGLFSAGKTQFQLRDNTGNELTGEISQNIYDGSFHHCVLVVESTTTATFYTDGTSRTVTYAATNAALASYSNFDFAMGLGARNLRGSFDLYSTCTLDEVAFYPTRLTGARVTAHYNAAAAVETQSFYVSRRRTVRR